MRFFHLSDLHFGKQLYHLSLLEDQAYWADMFLEKCDAMHPDAVVIAGDVYDRRLPPTEAVTLLDSFLTRLAERNIPVLIIAGNHDSGERLSFCQDVLKNSRIYIAGEVQKEIRSVTLEDAYGPVHFWLQPFVFPKAVEAVVEEETPISGYKEAMKALLRCQKINPDERNVLVAHQYVSSNGLPAEMSGSESIMGGVGEMDSSLFDAFDYVALGHIHAASMIGRPETRYAGCPLYYDFSECERRKDLTLIEMEEKGTVRIERVPIPLKHRMDRIRGSFQDVLTRGRDRKDLLDTYFQILLTDERLPARAAEQLREVYGENLLNISLDREARSAVSGRNRLEGHVVREMRITEQFGMFYAAMTEGKMPDSGQEALLEKILEQQDRGDLNRESGKVPEEDTEELLTLLMKEESI